MDVPVAVFELLLTRCLWFTGELDANRPVPFRLTPNIAEFLTATGVTGPLTAAMVSSARCFVQPQYKLPSFLRAMLRDEYITWHKKVGTGDDSDVRVVVYDSFSVNKLIVIMFTSLRMSVKNCCTCLFVFVSV